MILSVDASNTSSEVPPMVTVSISSGEDDIEGGTFSSSDSVSSSQDGHVEQMRLAKAISSGGYTRRLSQHMSMSQRRRSAPPSAFQNSKGETSESNCDDIAEAPPASSFAPNHLPKIIEVPSGKGKSRRSPTSSSVQLLLTSIFVVGGFFCFLAYQYNEIISLRRELLAATNARMSLQHSHASLTQELQSANQSLNAVKHAHEKMAKVNHDMNEHIEGLKKEVLKKRSEGQRHLERLSSSEQQVELAKLRLDQMVERIQTSSREKAVKKFGAGPHQVEIDVQLPSSPTTSTIKIELAPLDLMPHSVHTFLEQVEMKAWDGTQFNLHAGHVLMAAPDEKTSMDVPTVSFPEYSEKFPHLKYTVAFPGRASSNQDFYINLRPNDVHHSPRLLKDGSYIEGEPCFGRIVDEESKKVVDVMDSLSVGPKGFLEEPVTIKAARIVR